MKRIPFLLLCLAPLLVFGNAGIILPEDWRPLTGAQYNMTFYAQVLRPDGTAIDGEASILAAFGEDGECRGAITPIDGPAGRLFQLGIASSSATESGLSLRVLDSLTGEVCPIRETVDFANDAIVPEGGLTNPLVLHVLDDYLTLRLEPGWNLVAIPFGLTAKDEAGLLALRPFAVAGPSYARATSIEANRGYLFFVSEAVTFLLVPEGDAEAPGLVPGWQLSGTEGADPSWLDEAVLVYGWDGLTNGFTRTAVHKAGKAYWILR